MGPQGPQGHNGATGQGPQGPQKPHTGATRATGVAHGATGQSIKVSPQDFWASDCRVNSSAGPRQGPRQGPQGPRSPTQIYGHGRFLTLDQYRQDLKLRLLREKHVEVRRRWRTREGCARSGIDSTTRNGANNLKGGGFAVGLNGNSILLVSH